VDLEGQPALRRGRGASADDPLDPSELQFTTEDSKDIVQRTLPTFPVAIAPLGGGLEKIGSFNPVMVVHGEQGVTLHREVPVEGELEAVSTVVGIYDKGWGAVVVTETAASLVSDGQPLFTTTSSIFARGEGGFGGDRGPSPGSPGGRCCTAWPGATPPSSGRSTAGSRARCSRVRR
jgi:hypothetical protein